MSLFCRSHPPPRSKTPTNSSTSSKRCHHSWGPCPKDFTHHSSRSTSMERTTRRSGSPWGYSSSSSSGGSPVVRKIRMRNSKVSDEEERCERLVSCFLPYIFTFLPFSESTAWTSWSVVTLNMYQGLLGISCVFMCSISEGSTQTHKHTSMVLLGFIMIELSVIL